MPPKKTQPEEPVQNPQTYAEFYRLGWAQHGVGKNDQAEANLRKAVELEPASVDAHYALGLALKAQDRRREAIQEFQTVVSMIEADPEHNSRTTMVRRLAKGWINLIEKGDWDLEEEIWKRKSSPTANV